MAAPIAPPVSAEFVLGSWLHAGNGEQRSAVVSKYPKKMSWFHGAFLRNNDCVSGLQLDVLLWMISLDYFFVVKGIFHLFAGFVSQDVDSLFTRKLRETTGTGQRLQNGHIRQHRKYAGSSTSPVT